MIYLLTHPITKHKVLLVKTTSNLPFDDNQTLNSYHSIDYIVNNKVFANVSLIPNYLEGTDEEAQSISNSYFNEYMFKKFDDVDTFSAYVIFQMGS
jgi:hypothetical protein